MEDDGNQNAVYHTPSRFCPILAFAGISTKLYSCDKGV